MVDGALQGIFGVIGRKYLFIYNDNIGTKDNGIKRKCYAPFRHIEPELGEWSGPKWRTF
jgi:hypothetical protein